MTQTNEYEGVLRCDHCGQTFLVNDGDMIKIDHFADCPGDDDD